MKAIAHFFTANGLHPPTGLFDTMLAEYLLDPSRDRYVLRDLAVRHLGREGETPDRLLADARRQVVLPEQVLAAAEHAADVLPDIGHAQQRLMEANGQTVLYETIEKPLAIVLEEMEREGFRVDPDMLVEYGRTLQVRILALEKEIHRLAGEAFNILSPKQLGIILFEKLNLTAGKKTKTGYSTDADVLEALADEHAIIPALLEYRQFTKLKSTYADGLLKVISPVTGRVHSSFNQTVAVTGRISSTEPNLQNIPIRTEAGRLIRKAFLPKDGYVFVDADYSQIELRVLAHVTGDETLKSAFHNGTDIHALTASQVFNVPLSGVTSEMRRRAKAVNFGIIYGISDYGLSRDLGIYRKEASAYIEGYLNTYPGVRRYMEEVVEEARQAGFVETLLHRRRYLPELKSANFNIRSFGKRVALNTPIQGTAADIIKIAMIRVRDALLVKCPAARLILQVHDELVVETPAADVLLVEDVVRGCMEHAMTLSVPIVADVGHGPNWYDAKH
jgi:DNA polymerase-1